MLNKCKPAEFVLGDECNRELPFNHYGEAGLHAGVFERHRQPQALLSISAVEFYPTECLTERGRLR
jgi:hypothetical protein